MNLDHTMNALLNTYNWILRQPTEECNTMTVVRKKYISWMHQKRVGIYSKQTFCTGWNQGQPKTWAVHDLAFTGQVKISRK